MLGIHLAEQVLSQVSILQNVHGHEYLEVSELHGVWVPIKGIFDYELQVEDD